MERTYKYNNSYVTIKFGSILNSEAEVIVSSDDCFLTMGGGVSKSIKLSEGTGAVETDAVKMIPANLGDVVVTTAGTLRQKFIFHAITIGYVDQTPLKPKKDENTLIKEEIHEYIIRNSVTKCFGLMRYLNVSSIAFPTIGGGTARIPYQLIAKVMAESMSDFLNRTSLSYQVELYIYTGVNKPNYIQYIDFFEQFASHVTPDEDRNVASQGVNNPKVGQSETYDVFISYSRSDSSIADEIVKSLDEMGLKYWIDRSGEYSGKNYKSVIVDKIRHSFVILFLSSENSNKSDNVTKEISVAVELKKYIIPVRLDKSPYADSITYDLSGIDYIDYEKEKEVLEQKVRSQLVLLKNAQQK